jgi:hypothetical protein
LTPCCRPLGTDALGATFTRKENAVNTLAACAIVRDEARNIAEWIAFHRLVGMSRFFIYDDRSVDDSMAIAERMNRGDITIHRYDEGWHVPEFYGLMQPGTGFQKTPQCCAYTHCSRVHAEDAEWCAYIDVDEFLFHTDFDSLPDYLDNYPTACGIVANWMVFGSNGHATRPIGLTIENYTQRASEGQPDPWGKHIKTIVRMECGHRWGLNGSHVPFFDGWMEPITQYGNPNPWSMTPNPTSKGLRINHYYHRSHEEAAAKAIKNDHNAPPGYPNAERVVAHDRNEIEDHEILRFLPALKKELEICD